MFIVLLYCYCILKLIFFSILEWTSNYLSSKRADSCLQFSQATIEFLFKLSDMCHKINTFTKKMKLLQWKQNIITFKTCCYRVIFRSESIRFGSTYFLKVTFLCTFDPFWLGLNDRTLQTALALKLEAFLNCHLQFWFIVVSFVCVCICVEMSPSLEKHGVDPEWCT